VIDSHAHLDACSRPEADLVADAERAGVRHVLAIGMDGASCRAALAAAEAFPQVHAAIGRHPTMATGFDDADASELAALAGHERCAAIGETGLDFKRDYAPRPDMERAFRAQMELARATGKPLVVHTREAADETIALLDAHAPGHPTVMHCFSLTGHLDACLERGWWISFAGNVTYPRSDDLRAAAERVPEDRLLVETDAPYLAAQPVRGKENEPAHVVHTARRLAEVRGVTYEELERTVERNAAEVFGW
jgi:TatD DNase family protein